MTGKDDCYPPLPSLPRRSGQRPGSHVQLSVDGFPHTRPLHVISAGWGRQKVLDEPAEDAICLGALYDTGVKGRSCSRLKGIALQKVLQQKSRCKVSERHETYLF